MRYLIAPAMAAAALFATVPANANGFFLEGGVGGSKPNAISNQDVIETDNQAEVTALSAVGYTFDLNDRFSVSAGVDGSFVEHDAHGLNAFAEESAVGNINVTTAQATLEGLIRVTDVVGIYAGGGVGLGIVDVDSFTSSQTATRIDETDYTLSYSGTAGLDFTIDENWSVRFGGRYMAIPDYSVAGFDGELTMWRGEARVRYTFN